ncbi:hypothetical protein KY346_06780 [Candidatus Woesearchaeota archaeon]|nr:hypothetical protein [Candidatus Woesearchaeota archaeon]
MNIIAFEQAQRILDDFSEEHMTQKSAYGKFLKFESLSSLKQMPPQRKESSGENAVCAGEPHTIDLVVNVCRPSENKSLNDWCIHVHFDPKTPANIKEQFPSEYKGLKVFYSPYNVIDVYAE